MRKRQANRSFGGWEPGNALPAPCGALGSAAADEPAHTSAGRMAGGHPGWPARALMEGELGLELADLFLQFCFAVSMSLGTLCPCYSGSTHGCRLDNFPA